MAEEQSSTIPGVKIEHYDYATIYEGNREALLAAGLGLQPQWLADDRMKDTRGRVRCKRSGSLDGRRVETTWLRQRGKYLVYIYRTKDERERFEAAEAERQITAATEKVRRQLTREALAEGGPRGMAQTCFDGAGIGLVMAFNVTDDPERPYRFPAKTKAAVKEHFRALQKLFEEGGFEARAGALTQADSEFQRFMRTAAGDGGSTPQ